MKRLCVLWLLLLLSVSVGCKKKKVVETTCGGLIDAQCSPAMYCHLTPGCGGLDREGVCKPRPKRCPEEGVSVCGCDGKTYEGPCYAALSGTSVAYEGECVGERNNQEPSLEEPLLEGEEEESGEGGEDGLVSHQ